ncbi:MAG: MFS transporter [Promethearchaeota archaeon]
MLTHESLEKKSERENIQETLKKIKNRKNNYVVFSLVYFIISLIQIYVLVYIPLFHFDVLNVDRSSLSLIQSLSYLVLFSFPALGLFFDKFSRYKNKIIIFFSFVLSLSFLMFIMYNQFLLSFSIFLVLFLISTAVIRTGMSKLLLEAPDKKSEKNLIILINSCSSIGILLSSFLFKFCVKEIDSLDFWNVFFIVGWLITSPLLVIFVFMRKTALREPCQESFKETFKEQDHLKFFSILMISLIFLAYFFLWSDRLIAYPFSSYVLSRFGEGGFTLYSDFYVIFTLFNILGFYIAKRLLNRINFNEDPTINQYKKFFQIVIFLTLIYVLSLILLLFSDIIILLATYSLIYLLGGLFVVLYTTIFLQISRTGKNENLRYWIMLLSSNLASITFLPLGTFLSQYISMEILITMVISLTSVSILLIYLSRKSIGCGNILKKEIESKCQSL